jgi:uncharacterized protein (TIGR04255 family)
VPPSPSHPEPQTSGEESAPTRPLNVPHVPSVTYEHNYIRMAACELRFPELPTIDVGALVSVQAQLRREYPTHERPASVNIGPGTVESGPARHVFKSKDGQWTINLGVSSVALETHQYTSYERFSDQLKNLIAWTESYRDSDFFTRVGLRYVNVVPLRDASTRITDFVNPALVGPLASGVYGDVSRYVQEIGGPASPGKFLFRHGWTNDAGGSDAGVAAYVFDFDFYEEAVESVGVLELVRQLHRQSFDFFSWALGERARANLGAATPKGSPSPQKR